MDAPDLLDYALGQLDGAERERIEGRIAGDPGLADRLDRLVRCLDQLLDDGDGRGTVDGPAGGSRSRDGPSPAAVVALCRRRAARWTTVIRLARNWRALAWRGLAAVLFGAAALIRPGPTLTALAMLFGAFALVDGVLALAAASSGHSRGPHWGAILAEGLLGVAAGLIALARPWLLTLAVVYLIAAWALVHGVLEIAASLRLRGEIEGEWCLGLCGTLSIFLGLALGLWPGAGELALAWLIGAYALFSGGLLLALACRLRAWARRQEAVET